MKDELASFLSSESLAMDMDDWDVTQGLAHYQSEGLTHPEGFESRGGYPDSKPGEKESYSEHKKHCKAKHGKCPYEHREHKKQDADDISSFAKRKSEEHTSKAQHYLEKGNHHKYKKHLSKAQYYMNMVNSSKK